MSGAEESLSEELEWPWVSKCYPENSLVAMDDGISEGAHAQAVFFIHAVDDEVFLE